MPPGSPAALETPRAGSGATAGRGDPPGWLLGTPRPRHCPNSRIQGSGSLFSNVWLWRAVAGVLTAAVILISCIQFEKPSLAKEFPVCPPLDLCPSGWLYFQRKCYFLSESEAAWNSSQSQCSSHNASLLVIENHQELRFMMKITKQDPWIGLYKRNEEFFWVNGKALDNELFEVKGSGSCAYLESKGVSASGCYLTRKWVCSLNINSA
ncbi:C-type lectin domain family 2 member B-like [Motacilla alba alba]|uniref:C-type lectin domain family 2 member B-like n=1 Tax=Motacilla alba alba TaxID=1094192 RepID=UPI0018D4F972|nr:C-type lectin domain family 2 member B-like [Motacilla alba alba]